MALKLELKSLFSPGLRYGELPPSPGLCSLQMFADIGVRNRKGADTFAFGVVTPAFLAATSEATWGRNWLILPEFSWEETERAIDGLIAGIIAETWSAAARALGQKMNWEYEGLNRAPGDA